MPEKKSRLTQKKRKEITGRTKEWMGKLKLDHWHVDITYLEGDSEECKINAGAAAWVSRDCDYGRAYIYVNIDAYLDTEEGYDEDDRAFGYIVHEMIHILLADYDNLMESIYKTESEVVQVRERTTELLTRIMMKLDKG